MECIADTYLYPLSSSARLAASIHKEGDIPVHSLVKSMIKLTNAFNTNETAMMQDILVPQVLTLQKIFEKAAIKMANTDNLNGLQTWSIIALKAQEQCRKTLATIADIKNPKHTAFIKQQNNALNQLVNNVVSVEKSKTSENISEKNSISTNQLLSEVNYEALDDKRKTETIQINSQLEAMGEIDRG